MKVIAWIFNILSIFGILGSIFMIIAGNQPCSGDGCMIHFLYIIGTPILIISLWLFYSTFKKIRK